MKPYSLKCYDPVKKSVPVSGIFLLSRGRNGGRPAFKPNANCIILSCAEDDLHYFYWLTYGLWYTGRFRSVLRGNCVEVLPIESLRSTIDALNANSKKLEERLPALVKGLQLQQKLLNQITTLTNSYVSLFSTFNEMEKTSAPAI